MEYAKTIAMATDLLAEGRAEDVVQMVDPLLEPVDAPAASTGQILLHALRAQVELTHRDRPTRALELLPSLPEISDLCTCVRAEVALWRGWARTRQRSELREIPRALRLLEKAEELFDSIHDPRGRCWVLLGRAQAYFALDEFALMRRTLVDAESLTNKLDDRQAERWLCELSIPALRFEGRYDDAERHLYALRALGREWNDRRIRGSATAHEAALRYDLGQSPGQIIDTAETAETLLSQVETSGSYPLLAAYHAHVGALLRQGDWTAALTVLEEAESAVRRAPAEQAHLQSLRARIALRRSNISEAAEQLDKLLEHAYHLPHGRHRSHVALLYGRLRARQDRLDAAYSWLQRAHRNAQETGHRGNQLRTLLLLARTAAAQSDSETAHEHLEAADAYDDYFSVLPFATRRFAAEGAIAQSANRVDDAIDAYRHALSAAVMIHDRYQVASLQLALAQLEEDERAHALASDAHATFEALEATEEAEVASAMVNGTSPDADAPASALPHPSPTTSESAFADTLRRASLSVPLVANTWLQTVASLLSDRWMAVYRVSSDGIASLIHEQGQRPERLSPPSPTSSNGKHGPVRWLRLRSAAPTLVLGVEVDPTGDSAWNAARPQIERWTPLVDLALERAQLHQRDGARSIDAWEVNLDGFIAESAAMESVVHQMQTIQTSHSPVLITGERGTGKGVLARAIHQTSRRSAGPVSSVPCASMQQDPIGERLFGSVQSDGHRTEGAVHEAEGGTLILEDVDALPPSAQTTLLRLLETGEIVPKGGNAPVPVDVRIVATTDDKLTTQVRDDDFRPALCERLQVISVHMPALRNRRADIPLLVRHFLTTLQPDHPQQPRPSITQPAMEALLRYDWPGNIRQLRNELERALVHVESEPIQTIDRDVLHDAIVENAKSTSPSAPDDPEAILHPNQNLDDVLSRTEAAVIKRVLQACEGQVTASADVLGLSRQGLYKKMKRLGIDATDYQSDPEPTTASS